MFKQKQNEDWWASGFQGSSFKFQDTNWKEVVDIVEKGFSNLSHKKTVKFKDKAQ